MAKKILILDTGREWGGGTNSLLELLKRADRRRYAFTALFYENYGKGSVSDVATELEKAGAGFIFLARREAPAHEKALKEAGRALLAFSPARRRDYVFRRDLKTRVLPASRDIAGILKQGRYDMLYMNNQPSSNLEGIIAASDAGVPCVQHARIEVRLNGFEAEAVNARVNRVICVSAGVRDGLVESGVRPDKCAVVYNGIAPDARPGRTREAVRLELGLGADVVTACAVGSLIKRKRVAMLIEAASRLKDKGALRACIVAGDGPEAAPLRALAEARGVHAVFTGFTPDPLSYINAADVFVLASEKEGLPRVILEAMLMARPVVAFDVPGVRELVEDGVTGLLVRDGSAGALAEALGAIAADKARATAMGEAGRKRVVEAFGMDRYVSGVTGVFDEVLA